MKHFYTLLLLTVGFFAALPSQAAEIAEGLYRIRLQDASGFAYQQGNAVLFAARSNPQPYNLNEIWKLKRFDTGWIIINVGTKQFVSNLLSENKAHPMSEDKPGLFYIKENEQGKIVISNHAQYAGNTCWHRNNLNQVVNWEAAAGNSQWTLVAPTDPDEMDMIDQDALAEAENKAIALLQAKYPTSGQTYRLVNRAYPTYALAHPKGLHFYAQTIDEANLSQVFRLEGQGTKWTLRNVVSDLYINRQAVENAPYTATSTSSEFALNIVEANGQLYYTFDGSDRGLHAAKGKGYQILGWTSGSPASQWQLVPVTVDPAALDAVRATYNAHEHLSGKTYRLVNRHYGRALSSVYNTDETYVYEKKDDDYAQVFRLDGSFKAGQWSLQNVVTDKYVSSKAVRTAKYLATTVQEYFRPGIVTTADSTFYTFEGSHSGLHEGAAQGHAAVAWPSDGAASQWVLVPFTPDATKLQQQRADYQAFAALKTAAENINQNRDAYNAALRTFFEDDACTILRAEYKDKSDDELRQAMNTAGLPTLFQEMAVRVKQQKWSENSEANHLIKRFRMDDFIAHSDHSKWTARELAGTSFAFSRLTSPTGITLEATEAAQIYVGSDVPATCTLEAELVKDYNSSGRVIPLKRGVNSVFALEKGHIYIRYNINDTNVKLADCPPVKIHIEGGRVNGYYHRFKDTDAHWQSMKNLRSEGFLQDEVFRMKSQCYVYSNSLEHVLKSDTEVNKNGVNQWTYRGVKKSLSDVLEKIDAVSLLEQDLTGVDQFYDRFNCLHFFAGNAGLYASTYGVWMTQGLISYIQYTDLGENANGGNLWALAHETGHHFQGIIDIQGAMESSNNLMSNVALWKLGGAVSRGDNMKSFINSYNTDKPWADRTIDERTRMYYQLWLYYEQSGRHKDFYQDLANLFRANPIKKGNANTDYLYFARTVCDLVQEDLTEFFAFHGFFSKKKLGDKVRMIYGNDFYDGPGGYNPVYNQIKAEDIDNTIAYIKNKYSKKGAANLLFIDDRIRPIKEEGTDEWRVSSSPQSTVGDAAEVGDVGMFTDFNDGNSPQPSEVLLDGRKVHIRQQGAVGYKVYDQAGNLVFLSNSNNFVLPETLDLATIVVKVAGGNGQDQTIIENGAVLPQYDHFERRNTTGLLASTTPTSPEHVYHICNGFNNNNWVSATGDRTDQAQRASFALFTATADNCFYILNTTTQKWMSYDPNNVGAGQKKITWLPLDQKNLANAWYIEQDEKGKGFDVFPLTAAGTPASNAWNWHGGTASGNFLGLYNRENNSSVWQWLPINTSLTLRFLEGSNGHYSTLYLPYAVQLPEGVTAHTGTISGSEVEQSPLSTGRIVPPHTPVLLQATAAGTYTATILPTTVATQTTVWTGTHSLLRNAELDKAHYHYYALTRRADGTFVMGLVGQANLPATRAYLRQPITVAPTRELHFNFSSGLTGITAPAPAEAEKPTLYDLSGRRTTGQRPGLYLQGGRRVLKH